MLAAQETTHTETKRRSPDFSTSPTRRIHIPDVPSTMSSSEWEKYVKKILRFKNRRAHLRLSDGSIIPNVFLIGIYASRLGYFVKYRGPSGIQSLPAEQIEDIEVFSPMPFLKKRNIIR